MKSNKEAAPMVAPTYSGISSKGLSPTVISDGWRHNLDLVGEGTTEAMGLPRNLLAQTLGEESSLTGLQWVA